MFTAELPYSMCRVGRMLGTHKLILRGNQRRVGETQQRKFRTAPTAAAELSCLGVSGRQTLPATTAAAKLSVAYRGARTPNSLLPRIPTAVCAACSAVTREVEGAFHGMANK